MITLDGKTHIKRYLAGFVPSIAQSIGFGIGPKAEASADTALQYEIGRSDITLVTYDFVNNKLIFKAEVPDNFGGQIYEVGLFSMPADSELSEFGSRLITTFDSATEDWVDATSGADAVYTTTGVRVGADMLRQTPAASGTTTDTLKELVMDLSGYSAADRFVLAINVGNTNTTSLNAKFMTDVNNFYQVNFGAQASTGYKILSVAKGDAVATGTPNWGSITEVRVTTNSGAGGASQIDFDALKIEDTDTVNSEYVMVSRELLATPFTKQEGMVQEIEFSLDVNV